MAVICELPIRYPRDVQQKVEYMSNVPRRVRAGTGILMAFKVRTEVSGNMCGIKEKGTNIAFWGKPMSVSQVEEGQPRSFRRSSW